MVSWQQDFIEHLLYTENWEGYKKKWKIQFLFSESLRFIWKGKTNKGNICQVEDNTNYEMYSQLRLLKLRGEEES